MIMANTIMFAKINGPAQTPISNGSGLVSFIPGIWGSDDTIMAGNTTETRLIRMMDAEKRRTIQDNGFLVLLSLDSVKSINLLPAD